jgi:hypothetical protein
VDGLCDRLMHYQAFAEMIKGSFRGMPEYSRLTTDNFEFFDEDRGSAPILEEDWEKMIAPGRTLSMAMLIHDVTTRSTCPSCGQVYKGDVGAERVRW